jgi:putative transcriptional regulator
VSELLVHLRAYRVACDLTQAELAARVGVSRKTINTVENGVFIPSTVLALKLARSLKTTVHELFELRPGPEAPVKGGLQPSEPDALPDGRAARVPEAERTFPSGQPPAP